MAEPARAMLGELSPAHIDRLFHAETIGRLGCHAGDRTYVVPVTYAYDGSAIYGHTGEGMKVRMGLLMDRLLPLIPSETSGAAHGSEPSAAHRADVAGRPPVVYKIVIREKTGRFERR